ncbi:CDC27 family protein [Polaribacter cellanae]|uniref:Tetratricopeptide repeat protein n=1 Tax=Polaribacter cellanae TaxID=2818493 RepID=A0A975CN82_9FLAO|nr:CDC27 family protein [Polaribacter cellanae]QTE22192.1 tetratricopeptide repeat protein [Polaribacter cellanae]
MYYYIIIALQIFCFYHCYKNGKEYYWYFIIFFIPLIGCVIYLATQVVNKREVSIISEEITTIINPTKKIKDLEKKVEFSETFQNKINLADAYSEIKDFNNAILYYEKALDSGFKNDPYTLNKLIKCYFKVGNFDKVITYSQKINLEKDFKESIYFYGLALEQKGNFEEAETQLKKLDIRYSNYNERLELSNFLIRRNKKTDAKEVLEEMLQEIKSMSKQNAKKYRGVYIEAEKIANGL